jgi:hypothetical protein
MTYWSALWRIELRILLAVLVCAMVMAVYMAIDASRSSTSYSAAGSWAWIGFTGTIIFGLPVAALFGGPLYALLMRSSALTWPRVLLVGAAPSAPIAFLDREMASLFLICGLFVAGATHALTLARPLTMRWSGP